ncbi:MAG: gas vesicle accessory protein GvpU [Pseudomonadota bacterium]
MKIHDKNAIALDNTPAKDWFLQFLVNMANKNKLELGITLNVGGLLISGTLAGVKQYFTDFGADFAASLKEGKGSEEIKATFKKIGDECACVSHSEQTESPSYIHLKNVRFFTAQETEIVENRSSWWRGRISEVQGFVPGNLGKPATPLTPGNGRKK